MDWIVYYEFPEDTLKSSRPMPRDQAAKLMESLEAQQIGCCMEEGDKAADPIVLRPARSEYHRLMDLTSKCLIEEALRAADGNRAKAAKSLGLERTTLISIQKRLTRSQKEIVRRARRELNDSTSSSFDRRLCHTVSLDGCEQDEILDSCIEPRNDLQLAFSADRKRESGFRHLVQPSVD